MRKAWTVSLLVITCISVIIAVNNFTGDHLPDALTRVLGVLDLIAIVVLTYTSVKLKNSKKE